MFIKNFSLVICIFASIILNANNAPVQPVSPVSSAIAGPGCDIPAPFGFQVVSLGSTWVKLGWGGNVMFQHRVRIYRASDNALLSTTIVPAGITTTTVGIPFNTTVKAVINAICTNGEYSYLNSETPLFNGLILDLLVVGYQGSTNGIGCYFFDNGSCDFPLWGHTTFKVSRNGSNPSKFDLQLVAEGGGPKFVIYPQDANSHEDNHYSFACDGNCPRPTIIISYWQNGIAEESYLTGHQTYGSSTINTVNLDFFESSNIHYKLEQYLPDNHFGPSKSSVNARDNNTTEIHSVTVAPNPFTESLEVYPGHPTAEQITLQLFNLSGQKVLDQQYAGGSEQYNITTHDLAPGFYLLRIDAEGEVQTLKVFKSE